MKRFSLICMTALLSVAAMAEVKYMTTEEFKAQVFDYTKQDTWKYAGSRPCIIDFYTTWCGPCRMLSPIMEELSEEYAGKVDFYKIDIEKDRELAVVFGIQSIPTIFFCPVVGGPTVHQGLVPKETLVKYIDNHLIKK